MEKAQHGRGSVGYAVLLFSLSGMSFSPRSFCICYLLLVCFATIMGGHLVQDTLRRLCPRLVCVSPSGLFTGGKTCFVTLVCTLDEGGKGVSGKG